MENGDIYPRKIDTCERCMFFTNTFVCLFVNELFNETLANFIVLKRPLTLFVMRPRILAPVT